MSDLVERLRRQIAPRMTTDEIEALWAEAADEIERLLADNKLLKAENSCISDVLDRNKEQQAEIERLRAALEPFADKDNWYQDEWLGIKVPWEFARAALEQK